MSDPLKEFKSDAYLVGYKSGYSAGVNATFNPRLGWISIKDRLPTDNNRYLVYTGEHIIISHFYAKSPEPHFYATEATHWMPLPEAPE